MKQMIVGRGPPPTPRLNFSPALWRVQNRQYPREFSTKAPERPTHNRYTDDALDLCDALSSFAPRAKVSLHELCRVLGLPGKPDGIDGSQVDTFYRAGRIKEVAEYCETDIVNTYRAWLRYELFKGSLSPEAYMQSEANLTGWISARAGSKEHLMALIK